jgi:hypothetical protein
MASRHNRKEEQTYDVFDHVGAVVSDPNAPRKAKIEVLRRCGYDINPKTNSERVNQKLQEVFDMVLAQVGKDDARKRARNRRKRVRKKRGG